MSATFGLMINILIWTITWFISGVVVALTGFQLNIYSETENSDNNPSSVAEDLNGCSYVEIILNVICTVLIAVPLNQFSLFFFCCLMSGYNIRRYMRGEHTIDQTEVYKPGILRKRKRKAIYRILIYSLIFLLLMVALIYDIVYGQFTNGHVDSLGRFLGLAQLGESFAKPFTENLIKNYGVPRL